MSKERTAKTKKVVGQIRSVLEQDPDWPLVSGKRQTVTQEENSQARYALTRLSKKAVNLLFPEYKALSCHGSGTAYHWVHVNIIIPQEPSNEEKYAIERRATHMLETVGLQYGSFFTDHGPNDHFVPCLSVQVNDPVWGHY